MTEVAGKALRYPISEDAARLLNSNAAFLAELRALADPHTSGYRPLTASFDPSKVVPPTVARLARPHHEHGVHAVGTPCLCAVHLHHAQAIQTLAQGQPGWEPPPLPWALLLADDNTPADPFLARVWWAAYAPIQRYAAGATTGAEAILAYRSRIPALLRAYQRANDAAVGRHLGAAAPGTPVPTDPCWRDFQRVNIPPAEARSTIAAMWDKRMLLTLPHFWQARDTEAMQLARRTDVDPVPTHFNLPGQAAHATNTERGQRLSCDSSVTSTPPPTPAADKPSAGWYDFCYRG